MNFDNYVSFILTLEEANEGSKRFAKQQKGNRSQNKKGNMVMVAINKCEFGQLNDKNYILPNVISWVGRRDHKFIENFRKQFLLLLESL